MTWISDCAAAWRRYDAWLDRRADDRAAYQVRKAKAAEENDRLIDEWFGEERLQGVEDTGSIVATPEDLAEIGPFDPVTRVPRQGRGRHRKGAS